MPRQARLDEFSPRVGPSQPLILNNKGLDQASFLPLGVPFQG